MWDPRTLQIKSDWVASGPVLDIEFSRVSKDGRLTLVIDPVNGAAVQTYVALSKRSSLADAVADLRDREGTVIKRIGFIEMAKGDTSKAKFADQIDIFQNVQTWCESSNYDAAVWTALPSQFKEQTNMEFSVDNAISYLSGLPKTARNNALEYIRKAPQEVATPLREKIEKLGYVL